MNQVQPPVPLMFLNYLLLSLGVYGARYFDCVQYYCTNVFLSDGFLATTRCHLLYKC